MRKELKYYMNEHKAFLLYKMLSCFCKPDPNHGGNYNVKSLYFDRIDNNALHEKLMGVDRKGKVRIRTYNDSVCEYKLELKLKKGDYVKKQSIMITPKVLDEVLDDSTVINRYFKGVSAKVLKPKVIVSYDRKVLLYPFSDIRFTFDYDVRSSVSNRPDLRQNQLYAAIFSEPTIIFEVKYSHEIPEHLKRILMEFGVQSSISKYTVSRTQI